MCIYAVGMKNKTISRKHFNFQFAVKLRICFAFVSRYADAYRAKVNKKAAAKK
jgi:hypothetical protein